MGLYCSIQGIVPDKASEYSFAAFCAFVKKAFAVRGEGREQA